MLASAPLTETSPLGSLRLAPLWYYARYSGSHSGGLGSPGPRCEKGRKRRNGMEMRSRPLRDVSLQDLVDDPVLAHYLVERLEGAPSFATVHLPEAVRGFEDLAFLFTSSEFSMGITLLAY